MSVPPAVEDPGSSQSSTSTVKPTCRVPVGLVSLAWPLNWACLPVVGQTVLVLIMKVSKEIALILTLACWSLYSRFPFGLQQETLKPNVACLPTLVGLELC